MVESRILRLMVQTVLNFVSRHTLGLHSSRVELSTYSNVSRVSGICLLDTASSMSIRMHIMLVCSLLFLSLTLSHHSIPSSKPVFCSSQSRVKPHQNNNHTTDLHHALRPESKRILCITLSTSGLLDSENYVVNQMDNRFLVYPQHNDFWECELWHHEHSLLQRVKSSIDVSNH